VKFAASRWLIAIAAAFPLLCAYSCAVPLGLGYHIEKESVELTFVNQPVPLLHVDGHYRIENVGNGPLASLDVTVPEKDSVGRQNLRITVDGKDALIMETPANEQPMSSVQISFEPAWTPHQTKDIEILCDMAAGSGVHTILAPDVFAFDGAYWFPAFQAPKRLFAKGEQRAEPTDLSIVLPKDLLVRSSGQPIGRKNRGETTEYRFRLRDTAGPVFVVSGRYKQQLAKSKSTSVYFWTFQGLPEGSVKSASEQIADAAQFFDSDFVTRGHDESAVWVAEIPENISHPTGSFPSMILLDNSALAQNIAKGQVSRTDIGLLAETWLQWMSYPDPVNKILPAALENYMADAFYESRGASPNFQMKAADYLRQYDASPVVAMEKPLVQVTPGDSAEQVNMAVNKATLFLYALEDVCKPKPFRKALGGMLSNLRGAEYGYEDLRSALNFGCGQPSGLDGMFRPWIYEKGIPSDFRARYSGAAAPQGTSK
jgi:hypothetical protein